MSQINWKISRQDAEIIGDIVERASLLFAQVNPAATKSEKVEFRRSIMMDIHACHANGCRLRLSELAAADGFNFAHDVFGIHRHLNRTTGQLEDCFLPRYAVPEAA